VSNKIKQTKKELFGSYIFYGGACEEKEKFSFLAGLGCWSLFSCVWSTGSNT